MSSLTRWDPVPEMTSLREAMNQLIERAVMRPGFDGWATGAAPRAVFGAMNVFETNGRYHCQVLLPSVLPDDIDLTVRQNTLTLKGKLADPISEEQRKGAVYLLREFGTSEFSRSISFPKDVRGDAVEAHYEDGILEIVIPIAEHAQPRRITIQGTSKKQADKQPQRQVVTEAPVQPQLEDSQKNSHESVTV